MLCSVPADYAEDCAGAWAIRKLLEFKSNWQILYYQALELEIESMEPKELEKIQSIGVLGARARDLQTKKRPVSLRRRVRPISKPLSRQPKSPPLRKGQLRRPRPQTHPMYFPYNSAPGPGVYRLPSDFGHYDEPVSARSSVMRGSTARSKFIK